MAKRHFPSDLYRRLLQRVLAFYRNPYVRATNADAPRSPNPYIEEEPPEEGELPTNITSNEISFTILFANAIMESTHAHSYRSLMRKTVDHMMTYDDARHFGVARGILRPFEHDDPRNVQHV